MVTEVSSFRVEEIWAWKRAKGEDRIDESQMEGGMGSVQARRVSHYEWIADSVPPAEQS